uniref:Uncharacterized protein n=1 Tax=Chrysotila carterae TaxID=13221 RepID=A0A7S4EUQ1_CHRCT|eukprot:4359368-Pleurochrysis_carterae.AAC.1
MFKLLFLLSSVKSATQARPTHLACAFQEGDPLEIRVYISSSPHFTKFNDTDALVWHEVGLKYSLHELERTKTIDVQVTPHLYANGSFFAHMFITKANFSPDPRAAAFNRMATTWITKPLVAYDKRLKPIGLKKLLTNEPAPWEQELRRGAADAAAAGRPEAEYISYWKPSFLAQLVIDTEPHERGQMPPLYEQYLHGYRLMSGNRYVPLIYNNELTSMRQHWKALNSTLRTVPLELSYRPLPLRRFQWMVNLENSFKMNEENLGLTEKDSEDMRGMFVNTNPYLLYTTVAQWALLTHYAMQPPVACSTRNGATSLA